MKQKIKEIEFSKLRFAYVSVKKFLEEETREKIPSLKTSIENDLKYFGEDSYQLMLKFINKFELEHNKFQFDKHFHEEGELIEPSLLNLLTLSIWLPLKTIELLSLNKFILKKPVFHKPEREIEDMTFKDMLTWYIEGEYAIEKDVKYIMLNKS